MPVLVVAVYDENGTVQCMNAAWGQICDTDKIALFLARDPETGFLAAPTATCRSEAGNAHGPHRETARSPRRVNPSRTERTGAVDRQEAQTLLRDLPERLRKGKRIPIYQ